MKYTVKVRMVEYGELVVEAESLDEAEDIATCTPWDLYRVCDEESSGEVMLITDENGNETPIGW